MKITVGLGSIDDYIPFVEAGADECFIGYVPEDWQISEGLFTPLNRREVLYYNVQIGSKSELEILADMIKKYQVPVSITLNNLFYAPSNFEKIHKLIQDCHKIGFSSFIVADPFFLMYCRENPLDENIKITISGELGEVNHHMLSMFSDLQPERLIFHRKVDIDSMAECVSYARENKLFKEFEAFALNEKCHFHGGFCNSLHCDEFPPACRIPYIPGSSCENTSANFYVTGMSGCGFCKLWDYRKIGITHLKLVSRGNYSDDTIDDIKQLKKALSILEKSLDKKDYVDRMKSEIFPEGCSHNCY